MHNVTAVQRLSNAVVAFGWLVHIKENRQSSISGPKMQQFLPPCITWGEARFPLSAAALELPPHRPPASPPLSPRSPSSSFRRRDDEQFGQRAAKERQRGRRVDDKMCVKSKGGGGGGTQTRECGGKMVRGEERKRESGERGGGESARQMKAAEGSGRERGNLSQMKGFQ